MGVDIGVKTIIGFHLPISYFDKYKRSTEGKFHMERRWDQFTGKELSKVQVWDEEPIEGYSIDSQSDIDCIEDNFEYFIDKFNSHFDINCIFARDDTYNRVIFGITPYTNRGKTQSLYYIEDGATQCGNTMTDMDIEIGDFPRLIDDINVLRSKLKSTGWNPDNQNPRIYTHMTVS